MLDFLVSGKQVVHSVKSFLDTEFQTYGLILGGGLGYGSTKYQGTDKIGDIDLICLVENINEVRLLLQDTQKLVAMGFDLMATNRFYTIDLELFNQETISIIRFSGKVNGIKTTLNLSTFERLDDIYLKRRLNYIGKISHGKSQNLIVSTGSDGGQIYNALICAEVTNMFSDELQHFIVPDYAWFGKNGHAYTGILSDFIGKGEIVVDSLGRIGVVQQQIRKQLVCTASKEIITRESWHKMFASNEYFSENFRHKLNNEIKKLFHYQGALPKSRIIESRNELIHLVFAPSPFYNLRFVSEPFKGRINTSISDPMLLSDVIREDAEGGLSTDAKLYVLNAEAKRLSLIYTIAATMERYDLPKQLTFEQLRYNLNEIWLSTDQCENVNIVHALEQALRKNETFTKSLSANVPGDLAYCLTQMQSKLIEAIPLVKDR